MTQEGVTGRKEAIYLDICCLNRPFDDQTQPVIRLESEAIGIILEMIERGVLSLVGSDILDYEIKNIPENDRREKVSLLYELAEMHVIMDDSIIKRAKVIEHLGMRALDALHIASAEKAGVAMFLTVDRRILARFTRSVGSLLVPITNPLDWVASTSLQNKNGTGEP